MTQHTWPMADEAFEPTAEMRYLRPPNTTTKPDRLQQLWRRPRMNTWGHLAGWDEEWRDVPLVIDGEAAESGGVNDASGQ